MKKKIRIIFILYLVVVILTSCNNQVCCSYSETTDNTTSALSNQILQTTEIESTTRNVELPENLSFKSSAFYCVENKTMLFSRNLNKRIYPASLTKLLTACVAFKYAASDSVMKVSTELDLVNPGSSLCLILKGHRLTLHDLAIGLLVASGNDAAYTIAVNVARQVKGNENLSDTEAVDFFVKLMNDFAKDLGMKNSHFENPDGWDDEKQYSTAHDLLVLSEYALSVPEIKEIVGYNEKYVVFESGQNITWKNSNKLLDKNSAYYCKNAIGVKTGTTKNAGNCLIAAFSENHRTYISVAIGCKSDNDRYELTLQLFYSMISSSK